jgi:hypothetical protein
MRIAHRPAKERLHIPASPPNQALTPPEAARNFLRVLSSLIMRLPSQRAQRLAVRTAAYAHLHKGVLPNFIIVGAQKAGTTSLYAYLREHPNVLPCAYKEVWYFDLNFDRGTDWYRRQFLEPEPVTSSPDQSFAVGEATPYYLFHPWAAQRIAKTVPTTKIIVLLRNPIERAYSQYQHNVRKGRETLSFPEAIERERRLYPEEIERFRSDPNYEGEFHRHFAYTTRSCYAEQIEEYLRYFDRSQMLVMKSEDLFSDPATSYQQTLDFLGLPQIELGNAKALNTGRYDRSSIPCYDELNKFFEPHNRSLYDMLGIDFGW